jgi:hypothetical protein
VAEANVEVSKDEVVELLSKFLEVIQGKSAAAAASALTVAAFTVVNGRLPTDDIEVQEIIGYFTSMMSMYQRPTQVH